MLAHRVFATLLVLLSAGLICQACRVGDVAAREIDLTDEFDIDGKHLCSSRLHGGFSTLNL